MADGVKPHDVPDASVHDRTGRGLDEWFALLDAWGGTSRTHTEIARHLGQDHGVDGWWAQSVTVAYEQARGMRAPGQRADGTFSTSASKTVAVNPDRAFAAFADEGLRGRWLPGGGLTVRTATAPTSFRADWADGGRVIVGFTGKGDGRTMVALEHAKLPDAETAARMKTHWRERLAELKRVLEA